MLRRRNDQPRGRYLLGRSAKDLDLPAVRVAGSFWKGALASPRRVLRGDCSSGGVVGRVVDNPPQKPLA